MLINETALEYWLDHFYGYGSWQAKFWFVALEEGGGDLPEEVAEKLNYFYERPPLDPALCDVRELFKQVSFKVEGPRADLFTTLYDYRFGSEAILHGTWKNLIAFVHGYNQKALPDLLAYQRKSLAVPSKRSEALIRLYPLPSSNHHAWYYSWLDLSPRLNFLKSRAQYQNHVHETRMAHLLAHIKEYKPEVVLMYGMINILALKKEVQAAFPNANFKQVKAIKLSIPQHHWADLNGTRLLITTQVPALRHNRVETGFDWFELGKNHAEFT